MAGAEGVEPSTLVLETNVIPINYAPAIVKLIYNNTFLAKNQAKALIASRNSH